jgi:hypothetical protein
LYGSYDFLLPIMSLVDADTEMCRFLASCLFHFCDDVSERSESIFLQLL